MLRTQDDARRFALAGALFTANGAARDRGLRNLLGCG